MTVFNEYIVSRSLDNTVRIWSIEEKREIICFREATEAYEWIKRFEVIREFFED